MKDKKLSSAREIYMPYPLSIMPHSLVEDKKPISVKKIKTKDKIVNPQKELKVKSSKKTCNNCMHLKKQRKAHCYICLNSKSKFYKISFPHGKTREGCNLYKPLGVFRSTRYKRSFHPEILQTMPKGMKSIEDLHNIHKGEEIWVLGCGPSLDDFPDHFFDEKYRIAIAVSWSMIAFPNCTYSAFSQANTEQLIYVLRNRSHLLHKHIVRLGSIEIKKGIFIGPEPIYLRLSEIMDLLRSDNRYQKEYFSSLGKNLLDGIPILYASSGSCIHTEIQAAIVMGAKKVTLAGCEMKNRKFQGHAYKRGMDKIYKIPLYTTEISKEGYSSALLAGENVAQRRMRAGTAFLANLMRPHGIQIARYYYDKGYEDIKQ